MKNKNKIKKEHIFGENTCIFCGRLKIPETNEKECEYPLIIKIDDFERVKMLCENGYELKFVIPIFEFKYEAGYTTLNYILAKLKE